MRGNPARSVFHQVCAKTASFLESVNSTIVSRLSYLIPLLKHIKAKVERNKMKKIFDMVVGEKFSFTETVVK